VSRFAAALLRPGSAVFIWYHGGKLSEKAIDFMAEKKGTSSEKTLYCSFCGKSQHEVKKLIAGPSVFVCDECIELCNEIIRDELPAGNGWKRTRAANCPRRPKSRPIWTTT
jgi:hypothetical protein